MLQLWLDLGLLGALPALVLLGGAGLAGWRLVRRDETGAGFMSRPGPRVSGGALAPTPGSTGDQPAVGQAPLPGARDVGRRSVDAPWLALLTALILGGLLDGIFYHVLTLLPALLALGVVLFALGRPGAVRVAGPRGPAALLPPALGGAALVVLALHAFLFHALTVAPPPPGPETTTARLVRLFPSTTFGLWTWLDHWHRTNPDAALAWARWAQSHATNPAIFHLRAAQYLHAQGDRAAALAELHFAEAKAHWTTRPSIAELRKTMFAPP